MPGILGFVGKHAAHTLHEMQGSMFPNTRTKKDNWTSAYAAFSVQANVTESLITEHGTTLAFEGDLVDVHLKGQERLQWLLNGYLELGTDFIVSLDGSFRLLVHQGGVTRIFSDALGSRPTFYAQCTDGIGIAPETAPLLRNLADHSLDGANLIQFMLCGRFFAGQSPYQHLRQIPPGHMLEIDGAGHRLHRWWAYQLEPDDRIDKEDAVRELSTLLHASIMQRWERADNPAVLLSGGYDSRYIFNTLLQHYPAEQIQTVSWGEQPHLPGSDLVFAKAEAKRFGSPLHLFPYQLDIPELFNTMFAAQSGMTDIVFSHVDEIPISTQLLDKGIHSLFRGDEIFGMNGGEVHSQEAALQALALYSAQTAPDAKLWFTSQDPAWIRNHSAHRNHLCGINKAPEEIRDQLYLTERLPACLHHISSHRAHYLETVNPLLDLKVINFWRLLPAIWREDKHLFRVCYHRNFGHHQFASRSNGFNWRHLNPPTPHLLAFLHNEIDSLPIPFNQTYFIHALEQLKTQPMSPTLRKESGMIHIPLARQVARAIILGRWLKMPTMTTASLLQQKEVANER